MILQGGGFLLSRNEMEELSKVSITSICPSELEELTSITIFTNASTGERMEMFLNDIKNPYCFKINGLPVKINFNNHNKTLEESLHEHFTNKIDNNNDLV